MLPSETQAPDKSRRAPPSIVVVMGVAGAGKTTVARALATSLGWTMYDADDMHSAANVAKMRSGTPLTDADRAPWLAAVREVLEKHLAEGTPAVLACSALRDSYRQALIPANSSSQSVAMVQLDISPELAAQRLATRTGHYMPPTLVASQFATLEEPHGALRVDASRPVSDI